MKGEDAKFEDETWVVEKKHSGFSSSSKVGCLIQDDLLVGALSDEQMSCFHRFLLVLVLFFQRFCSSNSTFFAGAFNSTFLVVFPFWDPFWEGQTECKYMIVLRDHSEGFPL